MMGDETDKIIEKSFEYILQRYQGRLEESMKESEFVFNSADLLYYKLHKIILNRGESCIDSPKWLKNKKAIINPKNNDDRCFLYTLTVALNYKNIKNNPERISEIKPSIEQNNWKKTDFPSHKKEWIAQKRVDWRVDCTIALNILFAPYNTEEITHAYKSKYNLKWQN